MQFNAPNDLHERRVSGNAIAFDLLGNAQQKGIDAATLEDLAMRIAEGSNVCVVNFAVNDEMHLREEQELTR